MDSIEAIALTQRMGRRTIIEGLTLRVAPGVFGLLGPNGAGKTTLLRTLATALPVQGGTLRLLGQDAKNQAALRQLRRQLGYLPQHFAFPSSFTVAEFVEYIALLKEMPPPTIRAAVEQAIERVGLREQRASKLKHLSGGMIRRVGIAQAIVNAPALLLLDEPTVGLDPHQRIAFRALLREMGESATVVVSTHLIEDVAAACSTVALLAGGTLRFQGTPQGLIERGQDHPEGDSPLERGYGAILAGGWQ